MLEHLAYKGYDRIDSVLHMNTDNSRHLATEIKNRRTYKDMDKFMTRLPTLKVRYFINRLKLLDNNSNIIHLISSEHYCL